MSSPDPYTVLYGDAGISVVVPGFEKKERRRAAQIVWDDHVGGGSHLYAFDEFSELMSSATEHVWRRHSDSGLWDEDGDSDEVIRVFFFLLDDIPGSYAWSADW